MCKKNGKRSPEGWKGAIQLLIGNSLIRIQTGYPVYVCSESKQDKWYRYLYRYDHINPSLDPWVQGHRAGDQVQRGEGSFQVQYAWQDDPAKLSDNFGQAVRIAES